MNSPPWAISGWRSSPAALRCSSSTASPTPCPRSATSAAIDDRTAIVPLTQVSFLNGFRSDIAAVTRIAHDRGALVFLDGLPGLRHAPHGRQSAGRGFLRDRRSEIPAGPARHRLPLCPPRADRIAYSHHDQLDVAARRLRVSHHSSGPRAARPPLRMRYPGRPQHLPGARRAATAGRSRHGECGRAGRTADAARFWTARAPWASPPKRLPIPWDRSSCCALPMPPRVVAKLAARGILRFRPADGVRFAFHVYNTLDDVRHRAGGARRTISTCMVRA